jgi:hypothetical protein
MWRRRLRCLAGVLVGLAWLLLPGRAADAQRDTSQIARHLAAAKRICSGARSRALRPAANGGTAPLSSWALRAMARRPYQARGARVRSSSMPAMAPRTLGRPRQSREHPSTRIAPRQRRQPGSHLAASGEAHGLPAGMCCSCFSPRTGGRAVRGGDAPLGPQPSLTHPQPAERHAEGLGQSKTA